MDNYQPKPDSNLVWAILSTCFCCLPLGIVAIVNAAKVDDLYRNGDYAAAWEASEKAKKYSLYGAIACGVVFALYVLVVILAAIAAR